MRNTIIRFNYQGNVTIKQHIKRRGSNTYIYLWALQISPCRQRFNIFDRKQTLTRDVKNITCHPPSCTLNRKDGYHTFLTSMRKHLLRISGAAGKLQEGMCAS